MSRLVKTMHSEQRQLVYTLDVDLISLVPDEVRDLIYTIPTAGHMVRHEFIVKDGKLILQIQESKTTLGA